MLKFCCALLFATLAANAQSPLIRTLYVQDQRDRGVPLADNGHDLLPDAEAKKIQQASNENMYKHDKIRRAQTMQLLTEGKLTTAEDFHFAAFIFQHGETADDYLLAHILAMDAMAKGDLTAKWIAAATLDRYLQVAGKKQVFGTQYSDEGYVFYLAHRDDKNLKEEMEAFKGSKQTLEPYEQKLLPDAIRADFCIPEQKRQTDYITAANAGREVDLPRVEHCAR